MYPLKYRSRPKIHKQHSIVKESKSDTHPVPLTETQLSQQITDNSPHSIS